MAVLESVINEQWFDYDLMFNIPDNEACTKMNTLNLEQNIKNMTPQQRSRIDEI